MVDKGKNNISVVPKAFLGVVNIHNDAMGRSIQAEMDPGDIDSR